MTRENKITALYKIGFKNNRFMDDLETDWGYIYDWLKEDNFELENLPDIFIDLLYCWQFEDENDFDLI